MKAGSGYCSAMKMDGGTSVVVHNFDDELNIDQAGWFQAILYVVTKKVNLMA